jgi:hypothetical protein
MARLSRKEWRAQRAIDAKAQANLAQQLDSLRDGGPVLVACPKCGTLQEDLDGFGVLACDECKWCSHPSRDGDGHGHMVCLICGDAQSIPD